MTQALDLALQAERFLDSQRVDLDSGCTWKRTPGDGPEQAATLYVGAPGIVLFYLELAEATGESAFLERARDGVRPLIDLVSKGGLPIGLYRGYGGLAFCLTEVARRTGEERFLDGAGVAFDQIVKRSRAAGGGVTWDAPIPFSENHGHTGTTEVLDVSRGNAGTGLCLLDLAQTLGHDEALELAAAAGRRLLELSEETPAGVRWQMMPKQPFRWTAPNFSHGTSGVAYFFLRLAEATGDKAFADAGQAGAEHLLAIERTVGPEPEGSPHEVTEQEGTEQEGSKHKGGGACLLNHTEERDGELFYVGWCHGPPGTARLYWELARQTGEERWAKKWREGLDGLRALDTPHVEHRGHWNNLSQCCGDASIGDLALDLYLTEGRAQDLQLAREVARKIEDRAVEFEVSGEASGGRCWSQAEHRTKPDHLEMQTGYMQGAAGIASFLVHLDAVERVDGDFEERESPSSWIRFPDSPFR